MVFRLVQSWNALAPIEVTPLPNVTLVRLVQSRNALLSIEVTLSGIVMLVSREQFKNALGPIDVTGNSSTDCDISRWVLGISLSPLRLPRLREYTVYSVPAAFSLNSKSPSTVSV